MDLIMANWHSKISKTFITPNILVIYPILNKLRKKNKTFTFQPIFSKNYMKQYLLSKFQGLKLQPKRGDNPGISHKWMAVYKT